MFKDVITLRPDNLEIYADTTSIKRAEYYAALQSGQRLDIVFTVRTSDFNGENELEHEGNIYNIVRTYQKGEDDIELICQRVDRIPIFHAWELKGEVALYKYVTEYTDLGGDRQGITLVGNLPAKIETISGREYAEERRNKADISQKVTIAYLNSINKGMYFIYKGRKLNIEYIINTNDANVMIECFCREEQE